MENFKGFYDILNISNIITIFYKVRKNQKNYNFRKMKIYNKTVRIKKFINKITKKKVLKTINNHCIIKKTTN